MQQAVKKSMKQDLSPYIQINIEDGMGVLTLDRLRALNALDLSMTETILSTLEEWQENKGVKLVVIQSAVEKVFCAGGDLRSIYQARQSHDLHQATQLFEQEYNLNCLIHSYPKPYIALIDGLTLGGGMGLAMHGAYKIATENASLAMPETEIGFYPDVGAWWFYKDCPGELRMYLSLTGVRLNAADAAFAGLITHHVLQKDLGNLVRSLKEYGTASAPETFLENILEAFHTSAGQPSLVADFAEINQCFSAASVEAILERLEKYKIAGSSFATQTLDILHKKSPLSLKVTYELMAKWNFEDFETMMKAHEALTTSFVCPPLAHDFYEGIRAKIIDKDGSPHWQHASLKEVDEQLVESHFNIGN